MLSEQQNQTVVVLQNHHSMARANLNKSKKVFYYHSIKVHTESASIEIPPFLVKVPLNVNIVKEDLLNKKRFLKIL